MAKRISILGSTGSIGVNTLNVIDQLDEDLEVVYLSAYQNSKKIIEQAKKYRPQAVAVINDSSAVERSLWEEKVCWKYHKGMMWIY